MNDYVIFTDSTTDLPHELAARLGVGIIPLLYNIDGSEYLNYLDERGLDPKQFYNELRGGKTASTSAVNTSNFVDFFEPYLKEGRNVLYIAFSSALSGTCNNAMLAAEELSQKYPGRTMLAVDSLSASMGEGLLVYHAAMLQKQGKTIREVYDFVVENRRRLCHWFTVDDLNHLKRGGRVSATAALLGTVLGIKPILHVDNDGRLIPVGKVRGRRQSLDQLVEKMAQTAVNPGEQTIFISHGDAPEDAQYVKQQIKARFKVKEDNITTGYIGPVIGAHSGPGTVALFFLGTER